MMKVPNFKSPMIGVAAAAVLAGLLASAPASAQGISSGIMKIFVAAAPGGATDVVARVIGAKLNDALKIPVIVENRPGGFLSPAVREVKAAAPDGLSLFLITSSVLTGQIARPEVPNDLVKDFTPITEVATGPLILVARKDFPATTVPEIIAYNKQNPGKPTFGLAGGKGSAFDVATELFKQQTGIRVTGVPYVSSAPALNDILGGHIDMFFDVLPAEVPQVKSGAVKGLLVTSAKRVPVLPGVPTAAEAGLKDFEVDSWFGLIAPLNVPPAIVQQIRDAVAKSLTLPDVVEQLNNQGVVAIGSQPADWGKKLAAEKTRWTGVMDAAKKAEAK